MKFLSGFLCGIAATSWAVTGDPIHIPKVVGKELGKSIPVISKGLKDIWKEG